MSRGFDGPEIDDFHGPAGDLNRSPESNSRAGWDTVRRLERIRGEEERADQRDRESRSLSAPSASRLALMAPCGPSKSHKLLFMKEMLVGAVGIEPTSGRLGSSQSKQEHRTRLRLLHASVLG